MPGKDKPDEDWLDTSVVVRLLTGEPDAQARLALKELDQLAKSGASPVVSDLVIVEVYFALQYHYDMPKQEALRCIEQFLSKSGVKALGAAATVLHLPNLATAEPGFVDRLIHVEYMQSAKEVLTFEKTGGRSIGVRVLTAS